MSYRDIEPLQQMYGVEVWEGTISAITERVNHGIKEWGNWPLH